MSHRATHISPTVSVQPSQGFSYHPGLCSVLPTSPFLILHSFVSFPPMWPLHSFLPHHSSHSIHEPENSDCSLPDSFLAEMFIWLSSLAILNCYEAPLNVKMFHTCMTLLKLLLLFQSRTLQIVHSLYSAHYSKLISEVKISFQQSPIPLQNYLYYSSKIINNSLLVTPVIYMNLSLLE